MEAAIEDAIAALDALDGDADLEDVSEDEGAACEDEGWDSDREPCEVGGPCEYDGDNQTRVLVGRFESQRFYRQVA